LTLAGVARRQAMTGPMPLSRTSASVSGTVKRSNSGGPSARFSPVTASAMSGKNVRNRITNAIATSTTLLKRKIASRESMESSRCSERSASRRETTSATDPTSRIAMKITNGVPRVEAPNAWIESRIPERTRNVPRIARIPVPRIRETFQTFSIPRRSWIMIECRNAVPVSQGSSDAFSTGSHAQ
jgi:hypothetical protein